MSSAVHVPVLLDAVLEGLNINENGVYVDATFGRGGHSGAIIERLGSKGRLIAIDRDPAAIEAAPEELKQDPRFELIRGPNAQLEKFISERQLTGAVDGLLLDLGVSSPQLDEPHRGFSFLRDGPLDMRMDPDTGISAAAYLEEVEEMELRRTLKRYGEEPHAARIAAAIVRERDTTPITTTGQLANIVLAAVPAAAQRQKRHAATRTFQALRIEINDELAQLKSALAASLAVLRRGGRLCVLSFQSLEDRIVKRFMREHSRDAEPYRGLPVVPDEFKAPLSIIGKARTATAAELDANRRARSARLRIAERC